MPVTHEFAGSGVDYDLKHYWRCECGWETDPVPSVKDAADALADHLREIAAPTRRGDRSGAAMQPARQMAQRSIEDCA